MPWGLEHHSGETGIQSVKPLEETVQAPLRVDEKTPHPAGGCRALGGWSQDLGPFVVTSFHHTKLGSLLMCTNEPINDGIWLKGENQLYSVKATCGETGGRCPEICLPSPGFGVEFKRLGRLCWHTEMLVGQVLIGGLQVFMVTFWTFMTGWGRNLNTRSSWRRDPSLLTRVRLSSSSHVLVLGFCGHGDMYFWGRFRSWCLHLHMLWLCGFPVFLKGDP